MEKNNQAPDFTYNLNVKALRDGAKEGYCRICNTFATLTRDHIPPKSCGNSRNVRFTVSSKQLIFQNGFFCRTICDKCNNELLGTSFDKEIKKLYDAIKNFKNSSLYVPRGILKISVDTEKIIKGILGHFLATSVYNKEMTIEEVLKKPVPEVPLFDKIRRIVLGDIEILNDFNIYYWYYPYSNIVINPFFGYVQNFARKNKKEMYCALIKFNPIALCIINKKSSSLNSGGTLFDYKSNLLKFDLNNVFPKEYLEHPYDNDVIIMNNKIVIKIDKE